MSIDIEKERAAFESDAELFGGWSLRYLRRRADGGAYANEFVENRWQGWQAARATQQAPTPAAPEGQTEALVSQWKRLNDDDKPDATRSLDVVLCNGVTLTGKHYTKIDWSAVLDWRYSDAAPLPRQAAVQGEGAQLAQANARLLKAVKAYASHYMQDEAESEDDPADLVCSPEQHAEAVEVFAAIEEVERAVPQPQEQP